jgi:hypothetical protein
MHPWSGVCRANDYTIVYCCSTIMRKPMNPIDQTPSRATFESVRAGMYNAHVAHGWPRPTLGAAATKAARLPLAPRRSLIFAQALPCSGLALLRPCLAQALPCSGLAGDERLHDLHERRHVQPRAPHHEPVHIRQRAVCDGPGGGGGVTGGGVTGRPPRSPHEHGRGSVWVGRAQSGALAALTEPV